MPPSLESGSSRPSTSAAPPPPKLQMTSRSRTQSISSDRPSTIAHSFMSPPLTVSPEAAFIAASAASQIVTNDHDSHADAWYDQHGLEPSGEAAAVSPAALQLVNSFLDQLLFNFLAIARSTSLSALRPAVSEVLKPKLAKDAVNLADEELREYLGGDDEDLDEQSPDPVSPRDWDLELAWKRTRLRCMVYSSLGDMEEEDEDYYMEQGHLDAAGARPSEVVSPAVAIFLTSIMEFMGETALIVAGQAAYHRMRTRHEKDLRDGIRSPSEPVERITVEELDMERVALDRTLGRLWRAWKKKIRSPGLNMDQRMARSFSRESASGQIRSPSSFTAEHTLAEDIPEALPEDHREVAEEVPVEEYLAAAAIPLPEGERDVDEIEVPGLAYYSDDETEAEEEDPAPTRPKSWVVFAARVEDADATPTEAHPEILLFVSRKRSNSVPTRAAPPLRSLFVEVEPPSEAGDDETTVGELAVEELIDASPELSPRGAEEEDEETATIGQALTTQDDLVEEPEYLSDDEVVIEEPQIMISSRVSIAGSGRSSSPAASERGKPAAIITNLPLRTPSLRSARLIDVAPRSPALASRRSSADATESLRQVSTSRVSGGTTPPIIEERMRRSPDSMSAFRAPAFKSGLSETHSISEAEEVNGADDSAPNSAVHSATSLRPEPIPTVYEEQPQLLAPSRTVFGSVAQRAATSPVDAPAPQPVTRVTILPSTGTTFYDDLPEQKPEPPRKPAQTRPQPVTPTNTSFGVTQPPVPERSAVRQSPSQANPSTIGQVYVERSRNRSPSEPSGPRPHESPASVRQQHTSGSNSSASTSRLKPVRTSEETTRSRKDVARNFEELIHSDETIQYTLTPESMRDIDVRASPPSLGNRLTLPGPVQPLQPHRKPRHDRQDAQERRRPQRRPISLLLVRAVQRPPPLYLGHPLRHHDRRAARPIRPRGPFQAPRQPPAGPRRPPPPRIRRRARRVPPLHRPQRRQRHAHRAARCPRHRSQRPRQHQHQQHHQHDPQRAPPSPRRRHRPHPGQL